MKMLSSILPAVLALSCSLPHEPGPQPTTIVETDPAPRLVVFAVFRPDTGMSFVEVSGSYSLDGADNTEPIDWSEPAVTVTDSATGELFFFETAPDDTAYSHFYLDDFAARVGHTYEVTVTSPDYAPLSGSTTVPPVPTVGIRQSTGPGYLHVTFVPNDTLFSFDLNLLLAEAGDTVQTKLRKTIAATGAAELTVEFGWSDHNLLPEHLVIYGYERNLGEYLGTIVSIKPQSYQPQNFYIEGGYGVVGALNFTGAITLSD